MQPIIQIDKQNMPLFIISFNCEMAKQNFMATITYNREADTIRATYRFRRDGDFTKKVFLITDQSGNDEMKYTDSIYKHLKNSLIKASKTTCKKFNGGKINKLEFKRSNTFEQTMDKLLGNKMFDIKEAD